MKTISGSMRRIRLLNGVTTLILGNAIISVAHLKILLNLLPKDAHGLVYSDICPNDRQKFFSLEKIMQPRVRDALSKHVIGSEGTINYIRICHEVTSSLIEADLSPVERVFRLWRATFFVRAWLLSIDRSNGNLNVSDSFITTNAYQCIELNAENLII